MTMSTQPASYQDALDETELAELEQRFGPAPRRSLRLEVSDPFLTGENQLLTSAGRRAEICYIMRRPSHPTGDELLLHIKTFYPAGAFRLPTGGIHQGETVMETLAREIFEETGLVMGQGPGQPILRRYLGVVAYEMAHRSLGIQRFATYHFLLDLPPDAELHPQDESESIAAWRWCAASELARVANVLEQVGARVPDWGDWGRYRALSHRFVASMLQ
jgi:NAD+ diphosphatase